MATQVLTKIQDESNDVFRLGDILPKTLWSPYRTASPAFVKGTERASDGRAGDGNSFTGAILAIAFEAVAVFGIYVMWHVLRLFL
jgi:hypothetical protein